MWIRVNISEIQIRIHSFWIRHTAYMSFKEEIYFLGGYFFLTTGIHELPVFKTCYLDGYWIATVFLKPVTWMVSYF